MKLSARNIIKCKVKEIRDGAVNAEIILSLPDGQEIVSVITRNSASELGLKRGMAVCAIIKASNVMIGVED
ncbi:MAG: TOBE domain-containing protein [Gammaproteobacteria bacterium]|nr:TOBE domain-containing protein [Gammaproteobacteria bacterium]